MGADGLGEYFGLNGITEEGGRNGPQPTRLSVLEVEGAGKRSFVSAREGRRS